MSRLIIFLLAYSLSALADDSVFISRGDHIFPINDSTISLRKEILVLRIIGVERKDSLKVDVYFEFENPGPEKDVLVGFVAPPPTEWIPGFPNPRISNFMTRVNDDFVEHKLMTINESQIETLKKECNEYQADKFHVFLFHAKFKKGINKVYHTYVFLGAGDGSGIGYYQYRLSTGKRWANRAIENFELYFYPGPDKYLSLPLDFGDSNSAVQWEFRGIGKLSVIRPFFGYESYEPKKRLYCVMKDGYFYLKVNNFRPYDDLEIREYIPWRFVGDYARDLNIRDKQICEIYKWAASGLPEQQLVEELHKIDDESLGLLQNMFYAVRGFSFSSDKLKKYFSQFPWYVPDPSVSSEDGLSFNDKERTALKVISSFKTKQAK